MKTKTIKKATTTWVKPLAQLASLIIPIVGVPSIAQATTILSNNLTEPLSSTYSDNPSLITSSIWNAQSFSTDSSPYFLNNITLNLQSDTPGSVAALDLYSNTSTGPTGIAPLVKLGTLTSPSSYPTTFTNTAFSSSGINLAPNTTYWAVLHATSGQLEWAYTDSSTGSGAGFQTIWTNSSDGGKTWNSSIADQPSLIQVSATEVPEPSTVLGGITALGIGMSFKRKHKSR